MYLLSPCPTLDQSLAYFSSIGFKPLKHQDKNLLSDGSAIVEIQVDRFMRPGIVLQSNFPEDVSGIDSMETAKGRTLCDPSGIWIYSDPETNVEFSEAGILGNYAGISVEAFHFDQSLEFYSKLGFTVSKGDPAGGWVILSNAFEESFSLMKALSCPHLFFNPSLTYFNSGNNPAIIQKLRDLNVEFAEEVSYFNPKGEVDNVILRDPGGIGFFLFND